MKKLFFLSFFVLFFSELLYSQSWVSESTDLAPVSTDIEKYTNSGSSLTVYQSSTYSIGRKLNTDSSVFISRSYHQFDLTDFPSGSQIDSVRVEYVTSPGSYSFKLTKVSSVGNNDGANWSAIASGSSMNTGIAYSASENGFISNNIKTEMQNLLGSEIILGALSENETADDSYADLSIWLHVNYRRPALSLSYIAVNYIKESNGAGQIGVGIEVTPQSYPSPKEFTATEGQSINLLAYDNQDIDIRRYVFNDSEAPNEKSKWDQNRLGVITDLDYTQATTVESSSANGDAIFRAWLIQSCKIDQTHTTEFDGDLTQQNTSYIVEQNIGSILTQKTKLINGKLYNFAGWTDNFSLDTTRNITPTDNQTYSVLYKYPHHSDQTTAYSNSSQRKFIQTPDGVKHICYESMDRVWYERSTDGGSTWILGNGGKPLSNVNSKKPSMSFYGNNIAIVWQEQSSSSFKIKIALFWMSDYSSSLFGTVTDEDASLDYSHNANPVIGWGYNSKAVVVWSGFDDCDDPFGYVALRYAYGNVSSNGISWLSLCLVANTDENSVNPTIATNYNDSSTPTNFYIAWEQVVNSSTSKIYYDMLTSDANNYLQSNSYQEASYNSGYSKNFSPSLLLRKVYSQDLPYLTWLGYRTSPSVATNVMSRYRNYGSWSSSSVYGNGTVQNFSINNAGYVSYQDVLGLGWSEQVSSGVPVYNNKAVKVGSSSTINTLSTSGKDIQINNSTGYSSMYVNSFKSSSLPYYFTLSQPFISLGKEADISIFNGREGVVGKNDAQLFFALGDISVDGQNIDFIQIPDTIIINTIDKVNDYLESESFSVKDNTQLTYVVQYGMSDSLLCASKLDNDDQISFKVELIDNQTNEILETLDEITYSKNNVAQYNNLGYQVNLSGLGERTVKLKLGINTSGEFGYSLSNRLSDQNLLAKDNYQDKDINSDLSNVTEYALEQNYPNPFNPRTTIKYQLPQDGLVTLKIYDVLGSEIATLVNEQKAAGKYEVNFDASSLSSGVYIYKIQAGNFINSKKMILIK